MVYPEVRTVMRSMAKFFISMDDDIWDLLDEDMIDAQDNLDVDAAVRYLDGIREKINLALDEHIVALREVVVEEDSVASQSI